MSLSLIQRLLLVKLLNFLLFLAKDLSRVEVMIEAGLVQSLIIWVNLGRRRLRLIVKIVQKLLIILKGRILESEIPLIVAVETHA